MPVPRSVTSVSARAPRWPRAVAGAWLALGCLAVAHAGGQAAGAQASRALAPFEATYDVWRDGKPFGDASLRLVALAGNTWRVDLDLRAGRGLMGLAGLNVQQSTVFAEDAGQYRPLSQATTRKAVLGRRATRGVYDWAAGSAHWQGDLKPARRHPVPLQAGDMSGLLLNLAVLRDARPGAVLHYRFVDDGRARPHAYAVAAELEPVTVDDMAFNAMRVTRARAGSDTTSLWVVPGVPMPVRILQQDDDDSFDLRLRQYSGA